LPVKILDSKLEKFFTLLSDFVGLHF